MQVTYAWGRGRHGVLAREDDQDAPVEAPVTVNGDLAGRRVLQLCAGELHTLALCEAGHVYSWGSGLLGALGHGGRRDERSPRRVAQLPSTSQVAAGKHHSAALLTTGAVHSWGWDGWEASSCLKQPAPQQHLSGVQQIAAGACHLAALTADDGVSTVGGGVLQAGMLSGVALRELAAGARHTAALATDGTVYVWSHGGPPTAGAPPPQQQQPAVPVP